MAETNIWLSELQDILRGAAGGFLFGIPLLYTIEVWAIGSATAPANLLAVLTTTLIVVWLLTQVEGFRRTLTLRPLETVIESIEAVGIGVVCAAIALILLRRITPDTPLSEALGKLIFEAVPFSLGVALARSILNRDRQRQRRIVNRRSQQLRVVSLLTLQDTLIDIDATLIGAVLIAFSIAPTEEIPTLAASLPPLWLLLIIGASLIMSYGIVFASGFGDRSERLQRGLLLSPVAETLVAYLVTLVASTVMLVFFQQLNPGDPWQEWLSNVVVLGLPASVGGAAGRILI